MVVMRPFCKREYIIILYFVYAPSAFPVLGLKMCFTLVLLHVQINMPYLLKYSLS